MSIMHYRDLLVWQKAMDLVVEIYRLISGFPKEEKYVLSDQMRRAVISIPSNIAEGQARRSTKEFIHFLSIAKGSLAELETQIEISVRLSFLTRSDTKIATAHIEEIRKMLSSLLNNLSTPH